MKLGALIACSSELGQLDVVGITDNSKKVRDGFVFVDTHNNPQYVADAVKNGAVALVLENKANFKNEIVVENCVNAYAEMSANWFNNPAKSLKLIGVTGTNGKTTITYLLKEILEKSGKKVGVVGTIQNVINGETFETLSTTPDAFELNRLFSLMRDNGCQYVILEVSSHALALGRVEGLWFDTAVFTNLTQDHLDYHENMENYYLAKKKLFSMCDNAVVSIDNDYGKRLFDEIDCNKVSVSADSEADYIAKSINLFSSGVSYKLFTDEINHISLKIPGKFTVSNSLCAIAVADFLGVEREITVKALAEFRGVKGRAEVLENTKDFTVIIDYAHTPDGLKNILKTFKACAKNRLIVLFGCGGDRDKTKRSLMGEIASIYADYLIITSDNPRTEDPKSIISDILKGVPKYKSHKVIENRLDAIKFALSFAEKDDIIVLAGKGHETYQIIGKEKIHFDEREVVKNCLS